MTAVTTPFELKSGQVNTFHFTLREHDLVTLAEQLQQKVSQAPGFLQGAGVVAHIEQDEPLAFAKLKQIVANAGMILIGVSGVNKSQRTAANQAGIAVLSPANGGNKPVETIQPEPQQPLPLMQAETKVVHGQVRSGQQIYAKDANLVVIGAVSAGAEVIADGSVHIYGPLRGRAVAGAQGLKSARVYCKKNEAELVSIAGNYWLSDVLQEHGWQTPICVYLNEESQLQAEPI